jgi:hypothetical protein
LTRWWLWASAYLIFPAALAESAPDPTAADSILPSPIPRARWSEDWAILGSEEHLYEQLALPFKRVPLSEDGSSYMSFGGEFRLNYESYDPADRGLTDTGHSDATMGRLVAHVDWHPDRRWRAFGQLGYTDASDREGGAKPGDRSDINLWQAFVDGRFHLSERSRVDVRLGRQIYEKAGYFVGAAEARGVRQFYDGIRAAWLDDRFAKLDVLATEFVDTGDGSFDMGGTGEYLWGASAGFRFSDRDVNLSFSYFGWDLEDRQFQQDGEAFNDERRHTLLTWINRPVSDSSHWAFDYYFAYQFGSLDDQQSSDISAFSLFGEWKYSIFQQMETPILGLKTSYFSGDSDPTDGKLETFYNPVFVTVYFSYARDVMPHNLVHLQPNLSYRFSDRLQATVSTDFLWRASTSDAFYSNPSNIGVPADVSSARFIGSQAQFAVNWKPTRGIVASMHLVQFWAGQFIEDGGGENQTYFRLEFNYLL